MTIEKELTGVKKNVSLKNYTTFRIGGKAKYFFTAKTKEDLIKAVVSAKKLKMPFFILGKGSNLLISDKGFKGLVVNLKNTKYKISNGRVYVEAGLSLGKLLNLSIEKGLTGLEWSAGIPGTVGGAIYGNAGWPSSKKNISSVITNVEVFNAKTGKVKVLKNKDCCFGYRQSVFKKNKNLIILSAFLKLKKGERKNIEKEINDIVKKRKKKIPAGFSAGSVFKNPSNFSAGELIEKCGLKGKKIGNAKISEKHANFIVNLGRARAEDVKKLINLAKKSVKNKFKINLEEEIQYLGF